MYISKTDPIIVCAPQVCVGSVQLYGICTVVYKLCTVVQYICTWIYIYNGQCLCVFVCPVYMSCVHISTLHLYKLCTVLQYICTWIYIYIYKVCVCVLFIKTTWGKQIRWPERRFGIIYQFSTIYKYFDIWKTVEKQRFKSPMDKNNIQDPKWPSIYRVMYGATHCLKMTQLVL